MSARCALRRSPDPRHERIVVDQLAGQRHGTIDDLHEARLLHLVRRGIADPHRPGTLYDGFAIDYGCYVSLLLNDAKFHVRDRGDWSTPVHVPVGPPAGSPPAAGQAIDAY